MSSLSLLLLLSLNVVRGERRNILCHNEDWNQMSNDGGTWTFYNNDANVLNDCSVTLSGSSSSISRLWLGSSDGTTYDWRYSPLYYELVAYVTITGVGSGTGYSEFGLFHRLTEWDSGSGNWNIGSGYGVFLQTSNGGRIWNRVIDSNGDTNMDNGVTDSSIVANSELKISIKVAMDPDTGFNQAYDIRLNDVLTHDGLDTSSYGALSSGSIGIWSYYTDLTVNKVYLTDLMLEDNSTYPIALTASPTPGPSLDASNEYWFPDDLIIDLLERDLNCFYSETTTICPTANVSSNMASDVVFKFDGYDTVDLTTYMKLNNLCDIRVDTIVDWFKLSEDGRYLTGTLFWKTWSFCDSSTYGFFYIHAVRHQIRDKNGLISYVAVHFLDPTPKQYIFNTLDA